MKEVTRVKTTKAIWSVDIVRSNDTLKLLIFDEGSSRTILRDLVDLDDISCATESMRKAFHSFGAPAELRTDGRMFFAGAAFGDLLRSFGISHIVFSVNGRTFAERRAKS